MSSALHPVEVRSWCMVITLAISFIATASLAENAEMSTHQHEALPVDESLSMAEAVDAAIMLYPTAIELAARINQANAWTERGQSWLADRPSLSLRYQSDRWGPNNGLDEYEAGIALPLWRWGGRSAVKNLGDTLSAESAAAGLALRWEIAGYLRHTLWGIALAENDHELAEQALNTAARLTASIERRYELGDVALSDVLLAQSSFLEAQTMLIEVTAALLDAERAYRSVSGLPRRPSFLAEMLSQRDEIEPDHPALALANAEVSRTEASLAVAEKTFNTGASLLIGSRRERAAFGTAFDDSIGIAVNIPFGGSSHQRTEVSEVLRHVANARAVRSQQLRALTLDLHEAAHSLDVVRQNLAAASERTNLAERHQAMSKSAYEKGELDLIDLLKVQAMAIAAKRQLTRLVIDQKRQTAFYNQSVGDLP